MPSTESGGAQDVRLLHAGTLALNHAGPGSTEQGAVCAETRAASAVRGPRARARHRYVSPVLPVFTGRKPPGRVTIFMPRASSKGRPGKQRMMDVEKNSGSNQDEKWSGAASKNHFLPHRSHRLPPARPDGKCTPTGHERLPGGGVHTDLRHPP